jgi:hypothetical protein
MNFIRWVWIWLKILPATRIGYAVTVREIPLNKQIPPVATPIRTCFINAVRSNSQTYAVTVGPSRASNPYLAI